MQREMSDESFDESMLTAYLDDELSSEERKRVEFELSRSESAREMLRDLRSIRELVKQVRYCDSSKLCVNGPWNDSTRNCEESSKVSINNSIANLATRSNWWARNQTLLSIAAAIAILLTVGSLIWRTSRGPEISRLENEMSRHEIRAREIEPSSQYDQLNLNKKSNESPVALGVDQRIEQERQAPVAVAEYSLNEKSLPQQNSKELGYVENIRNRTTLRSSNKTESAVATQENQPAPTGPPLPAAGSMPPKMAAGISGQQADSLAKAAQPTSDELLREHDATNVGNRGLSTQPIPLFTLLETISRDESAPSMAREGQVVFPEYGTQKREEERIQALADSSSQTEFNRKSDHDANGATDLMKEREPKKKSNATSVVPLVCNYHVKRENDHQVLELRLPSEDLTKLSINLQELGAPPIASIASSDVQDLYFSDRGKRQLTSINANERYYHLEVQSQTMESQTRSLKRIDEKKEQNADQLSSGSTTPWFFRSLTPNTVQPSLILRIRVIDPAP